MGHNKFILLIILLLSLNANAQLAPEVLPYQGRLTEPTGVPINYAVDVVFRIYGGSGAGCYIYEDSHVGVNQITPNTYGVFTALIGLPGNSTGPANNFSAIFDNNPAPAVPIATSCPPATYTPAVNEWRTIEVIVNGVPMIDKQTIGSSPYALQSNNTVYFNGKLSSAYLQTNGNLTQSHLEDLVGNIDISGLNYHNHDAAYAKLDGSNSFTGDVATATNIYTTGGAVGVGTAAPAADIEIKKNAPELRMTATGAATVPKLDFFGGATQRASIESSANTNVLKFYTGNSLAMTLDASQNVSMAGSLSVAGTMISGIYTNAQETAILLPILSGSGVAAIGTHWANTDGSLKYWDGGAIRTVANTSMAIGVAGNAPNYSVAAGIVTLNIPSASSAPAVTAGTISNAEYNRIPVVGTGVNNTLRWNGTSWVETSDLLVSAAGVTSVSNNHVVTVGNDIADKDYVDATNATNVTDVTGGSGLTANEVAGVIDISANVDNSTLEINADTMRIKDGGVTDPKIATVSVDKIANGAGKYLNYQPNNVECADNELMKWVAATDRWVCSGILSTAIGDITDVVAGSGLSGGAASGSATVDVNVDNSTVEIAADTVQVKDLGITAAKLAADAVTTAKIKDANVTLPKLANGTSNGQMMFWNAAAGAWQYASMAGLADGKILKWDAALNAGNGGWKIDDDAGAAGTVTSLQGLVGGLTLATGSAGNAPAFSGAVNTVTLDIPLASSAVTVTSGTLSNAQYARIPVAGTANNNTLRWNGTNWVESSNLTITAAGLVTLASGASINEFSTDGTFAGNSDSAVPTEKAVKTYVDGLNATNVTDVTGGSGLTANEVAGVIDISANVDGSTLEINADTMRIKDGGVTDAKIATVSVDKIANGAGKYLDYRPNNVACADNELMKWVAATNRWVCSGIVSTSVGDITDVTAGAGLTGGAASGNATIDINTDNSTVEINADTLRIKDAGVTLAKLAAATTKGQVMMWDSGTSTWVLSKNTAPNAGEVLTWDAALNAGSGGWKAAATSNAITSVEGATGAIDLINTITSGTDTGPTWSQVGSNVTLNIPLASNAATTGGGLLTNTQFGRIPVTGTANRAAIYTGNDSVGSSSIIQDDGSNLTLLGTAKFLSTTLGTNAAPAFSFAGDTNTGMYSSAADTLDFTTNGTTRFTVSAAGLNANSLKILNVALPAAGTDAVNRDYADAAANGVSEVQDGAANGQLLRWNSVSNAWVPVTLASGQFLLGNGAAPSVATAVTMSGDATMAATGAVTIANDAVTTVKILDANVTANKLAADAVTTAKIKDANVTLAKLANGTSNGQMMFWNAGAGVWQYPSMAGLADGKVLKWDSTLNAGNGGWKVDDDAGAAGTVASIEGASGVVDLKNTIVSGTDTGPNWSQVGANVTLNIPLANDAATTGGGLITKAQYDTFNNKLSTSLANTHIFVGSAGGAATDVALSGDATIANTGALTIANDAITTVKILDANVTDAKIASVSVDKIANGGGKYLDYRPNNVACADNELMKWVAATNRWVCSGIVTTSVGDITDVTAGAGLTGGAASGNATIDINTDNTTVEINADTLRIKALGVDTAQLAADSVTTAKIANDAVQTSDIKDANVTLAKLAAAATKGQLMAWDSGTSAWVLSKNTAPNAGEVLTWDAALNAGSGGWKAAAITNAITSVEGATGAIDLINTITSGTDTGPTWSQVGSNVTLNIPLASNAATTGGGLITKAQYDTFNNKQVAITNGGTTSDFLKWDGDSWEPALVSSLVAPDGNPNPAVSVDNAGMLAFPVGAGINEFSTDGAMAGNSDTAVPTEKATKLYADTLVGALSDVQDGTATGQLLSWNNGATAWQPIGLASGKILVGNGAATSVPAAVSVSGDATLATTGALTIANDAITTVKILDANVTDAKIATVSVDKIANGAGKYLDYRPNNVACADNELMKWVAATNRWVCSGVLSSAVGDITDVVAGAGLTGGAASGSATVDINTDNSTVEIAADTLQVKDLGISTAKLAANAVTTAKITDGNVTLAKLANGTSNGQMMFWNAGAGVWQYPSMAGLADGKVLKWDSTLNAANGGWKVDDDAGAAGTVAAIEGATGTVDLINTITSGTDTGPTWSQVGSNVTLNIPLASNAATTGGGLITKAQYDTFNTKLSSSLTNTHIFVGSAGGAATDVALSGDATIANTGALTIANDAITTVKILDANVTDAKIATVSVDKIANGAGKYLDYRPNNVACADNEMMKWVAATNRWTCSGILSSAVGDITDVVAGAGLTGGAASGSATVDINTDNTTVEINADTLRIKALGVDNAQLAADAVTTGKIAADAVQTSDIKDANVTLAKLAAATTKGQVMEWDSGTSAWVLSKNTAPNAGEVLTWDAALNAGSGGWKASAAATGDITDVTAGAGLTGGAASGNATVDINTDNSTVEIAADTLQVKDLGITAAKLAADAATTAKIKDANVTLAKLAAAATKGQLMEWDSGTSAWVLSKNTAPNAGEVLTWDAALNAGSGGWKAAAATGPVSSVEGATGAIDLINTITSGTDTGPTWSQVGSNVTLNIPLASNAATTGGGLITNAQYAAKLGTALTSGHVFVGSAGNAATDVAMSGDVTIDNAGATTIAADAVTTGKIAADAVQTSDIKNANVTLAKLAAATTAGQVMEWDSGTSAWVLSKNTAPNAGEVLTWDAALNAGSGGWKASAAATGDITDVTAGAGLTGGAASGNATVDINTDNSTVEIAADTLQVKDLGITAAKLAADAATTAKIKDANVTLAKLAAAATKGQLMEWDSGTSAWVLSKNTAPNAGEVLTWDAALNAGSGGWKAAAITNAVSSVEGATGAIDLINTITSGTDAGPTWSQVGSNVTLNIPLASNAATTGGGLITKAQYDTFNTKLSTSLASGKIWVGDGGAPSVAAPVSMSGDATLSATGVLTLAASAVDVTTDITGVIPLANGGTNKNMAVSNGGIVWTDADSMEVIGGTATAGKMLQSGATAAPTWSTPTYPSASGTAGKILRSDGTNNVYSTATYPDTTTINQILYSSAANTVSGLATTNTGALVTSNTGVPSLASGTTANRLLRTDGTTVSFAQADLTTDVTGVLPVANGGTNSSTALNSNRMMVSSGGKIVEAAAATNGQLLIGSTGAAPVIATVGSGTGISLTTGAGSLSIATNGTAANTVSTLVLRDASGNFAAGQITATSYLYSSDRRLKENIEPYEDGLAQVLQLNGKTYDWKSSHKHDLGLIAQEVEEVIPQAVETNPETGLKAVKYGNLIAPVIEAVKELYSMIKDLQKQVDELRAPASTDTSELESRVNNLEKQNEELKNQIEELKNIVNQNKK